MFLIKLIGIPIALAVLIAGLVVFGTILRALYLRRAAKGQSAQESGSVRAAFTFYKRIWLIYALFITAGFVYIVVRSIWGLATSGRLPW